MVKEHPSALLGELMKVRKAFRGHVLEVMSFELRDNPGYVAQLFIEKRDGEGVTVTQFFVPGVFDSCELAVQTALVAGRRKVDVGYTVPA